MTTVPLGRGIEESVRVRADPLPKMSAAGLRIEGVREYENADFSIRQDAHLPADAPSTPEHIKKFRKTNNNVPG